LKKYDIIIIGAGASGLVCASKLSDLNLNKNILLIDRMNKVGK
jgi:predicted flavoprotein YhiN